MYAGCFEHNKNVFYGDSKKELLDYLENYIKEKKTQLEVIKIYDEETIIKNIDIPVYIAQYCNGKKDIIKDFDNLLDVYAVTVELSTNNEDCFNKHNGNRFVNEIIESDGIKGVYEILYNKYGDNLVGIKELRKICGIDVIKI